MMLYLHIETSQERSEHTIMIIDQQRLMLINKTDACKRKKAYMQQKTEKNQKKRVET